MSVSKAFYRTAESNSEDVQSVSCCMVKKKWITHCVLCAMHKAYFSAFIWDIVILLLALMKTVVKWTQVKKIPQRFKLYIPLIKTVFHCKERNVMTFITIVLLFPSFLIGIQYYSVQPHGNQHHSLERQGNGELNYVRQTHRKHSLLYLIGLRIMSAYNCFSGMLRRMIE